MKLRCLILFLIPLLLFSSCSSSDSVISHAQESEPPVTVKENGLYLYVNIAAKKIHYNQNCRYLLQSKEENIVLMEYSEETLESLASMEYISCQNCD